MKSNNQLRLVFSFKQANKQKQGEESKKREKSKGKRNKQRHNVCGTTLLSFVVLKIKFKLSPRPIEN